ARGARRRTGGGGEPVAGTDHHRLIPPPLRPKPHGGAGARERALGLRFLSVAARVAALRALTLRVPRRRPKGRHVIGNSRIRRTGGRHVLSPRRGDRPAGLVPGALVGLAAVVAVRRVRRRGAAPDGL